MILVKDGQEIDAKQGFSWTTLFLGVFVPLYRNDFAWFLIMLIAAVITSGLSWLVFPFFYNNCYIDSLKKKGWKVKN